MKNILTMIGTLIITVLTTIACCGSYFSHRQNYQMSAEPIEPQIEYIYIQSEPEIITETEYIYIPTEPEFYRSFTERESWCLQDMAMREAEGEGVIGQCWVMYCVLCRAEAFGQSIEQVWESDAFKSSMSRTGKIPNDACNEALALIEEGWIPKPLWFQRGEYHGFGTPLCQYGNHCFSSK